MHRLLALCTAALLVGCVDDLPPWVALIDGAPLGDAQAVDVAPVDTGGTSDGDPFDARLPADRGVEDRDVLIRDGGSTDTDPAADLATDLAIEPSDTQPSDAEPFDAEPSDAEPPDAEPPDGGPPNCVSDPLGPERCNACDDDGDGIVDEATGGGDPCEVVVDRCRSAGTFICQGGIFVCSADRPLVNDEACNGLDDDCDGAIDEAFLVGQVCNREVDGCTREGIIACVDDRTATCTLPPPGPERCNGIDDDCDGIIDNHPVCGRYVTDHCQLWLGWSDRDRGPIVGQPADHWSTCPTDRPGGVALPPNDARCVGSGLGGTFGRVNIMGNFDDNDRLGVALTCADAAAPELAEWVAQNCAVYLGWADNNAGDDIARTENWGPCPDALEGVAGDFRCTSSGYDGRFRAMQSPSRDDDQMAFAFALRCRPERDPVRAERIMSGVVAYFAWAQTAGGGGDTGGVVWAQCPAGPRGREPDRDGDSRCAPSLPDGDFQSFAIHADIRDGSGFGVALMLDPAPGPEPPAQP